MASDNPGRMPVLRFRPIHEALGLTSAVMYPHEVLGSNLELWQRAGFSQLSRSVHTGSRSPKLSMRRLRLR